MITVGIVEDNREVRTSLTQMINSAPGFNCVCASDSAEAALRDMPRARPDVVLMDIHLPFRSGIECTRRLKDLCPDLQVLILTVYEDHEHIVNALRAGASGYLLKSSPSDEILKAIADVKDGGSPMTSQVARKVVALFREPASTPSPDELALTEREAEVLRFMSQGYLEKEIAEKMHVSVNTIKTHRKHIYTKLHVRSRSEILKRYRT